MWIMFLWILIYGDTSKYILSIKLYSTLQTNMF